MASKLRWAHRGTDISMRSSGDREKSAGVSYEDLRFPMRAVEWPTARVAVVAYAPTVIMELMAKFPL